MSKIMTPVANPFMHTRNNLFGLLPLFGSALLSGKFSLRFGKSGFFGSEEFWVLDERPVGQSSERLNADINADGLIGQRERINFNFAGDASKPLSIDTMKAAGLGFAHEWAMHIALDLSYLGEPQMAVLELNSVAPLFEAEGVVLSNALASWIARRFTCLAIILLHPAKESTEC